MASLLDIAATPRKITIQGKEIEVYGITAETLSLLLLRFPAIMKAFGGMTPSNESLIAIGPEAVAAIIACGVGHPGDKQQEAAAAKLGLGDQMDLLDEILRLTFPRGVGPFVSKLEELGALVREDVPVPKVSSPSQPSSSKS